MQFFDDDPVYVPRTAAIFRPTQAFIDWVNEYERRSPEPSPLGPASRDEESVIYLLPELMNDKGAVVQQLRQSAKRILRYHLQLYVEDQSYWPKRLNFKQLQAFFTWEVIDDIVDLDN